MGNTECCLSYDSILLEETALTNEGTHDDGMSRCYRCFRPKRLCYCDLIPSVENLTQVLILQHRRESFHPFNTARIVRQSLRRCELIVDHNARLANRFESLTLSPRVGLLYPGDDARLLTELTESEMPEQLVVLDGTWHHAKTLMRDIPSLHTLPRYKLASSTPGQYRIRREPNEFALSTLEATVQALRAIEPHTDGFEKLMAVFHQMIETQLGQSKTVARVNTKRRRGSANIPRLLSDPESNIVVAYGDQPLGGSSRDHRQAGKLAPIYWTAKRLDSGETFQCAIESDSPFTEEFLKHLRMNRDVFAAAVSVEVFQQQWMKFLRPQDRVVVYHKNTARMLQQVDASFAPAVILKSIQLDKTQKRSTLDEFLKSEGIATTPDSDSRASQRLANAVAYVEYLKRHLK